MQDKTSVKFNQALRTLRNCLYAKLHVPLPLHASCLILHLHKSHYDLSSASSPSDLQRIMLLIFTLYAPVEHN